MLLPEGTSAAARTNGMGEGLQKALRQTSSYHYLCRLPLSMLMLAQQPHEAELQESGNPESLRNPSRRMAGTWKLHLLSLLGAALQPAWQTAAMM